jgi:hypothetical protein
MVRCGGWLKLPDSVEKLARCDFEARKLPVFVISVPH